MTEMCDKKPFLFPPKFSAQERLNALKKNRSSENEIHFPNNNNAVQVFSGSFGVESKKEEPVTGTCGILDEAMDWEPSTDPNYNFQALQNKSVNVLTDNVYFVPDTNVFIHSLMLIKPLIERGYYTHRSIFYKKKIRQRINIIFCVSTFS